LRQSVIVPVLNGGKLIGDAISSALAQLGDDDEMIVIDNGSTDDTVDKVRAFGDARVRLMATERRGPAAARNAGLAVARGDVISFLDHDDYWPAGRNTGLLAALAATPEADAAYGRIRILVEPHCDDQGLSALDGKFAPAIGLHVYLFSRELLDRVGPMDETMIFGEDSDYIVRLRRAGMKTAVYDGDAAVYRRHDRNMTLNAAAKRAGIFDVIAHNLARKASSR
jgi:glycosyltransferase involved in cell wall biosynthesis